MGFALRKNYKTEELISKKNAVQMFDSGFFNNLEAALQSVNKMPQPTFDKIVEKNVEMNVAHPFREGNTRTTAVFIERYLNSIGFPVNNDMFQKHAQYFRNALVRSNYANYPKGI